MLAGASTRPFGTIWPGPYAPGGCYPGEKVGYAQDFERGGEARAYALYVLARNGRAPIGEPPVGMIGELLRDRLRQLAEHQIIDALRRRQGEADGMVFIPGGEFLRGRSHTLPDDDVKWFPVLLRDDRQGTAGAESRQPDLRARRVRRSLDPRGRHRRHRGRTRVVQRMAEWTVVVGRGTGTGRHIVGLTWKKSNGLSRCVDRQALCTVTWSRWNSLALWVSTAAGSRVAYMPYTNGNKLQPSWRVQA